MNIHGNTQKQKRVTCTQAAAGSVLIQPYPWHIIIRDSTGKLLTETNSASDNASTFTPVVPFSFVRRASDLSRSVAALSLFLPMKK